MLVFPKTLQITDKTGVTTFCLKIKKIEEKLTTTTNRKFEVITFGAVKIVPSGQEIALNIEGERIIWGPREYFLFDGYALNENGNEMEDFPIEKKIVLKGNKSYKTFKEGDLFFGKIYKYTGVSKNFNRDEIEFNCVVFKDESPLDAVAKQLYYQGYYPLDKNGEPYKKMDELKDSKSE